MLIIHIVELEVFFHLLTAGTKYIINTEKLSFHCLQKNFLMRQFPYSR